MTYCDNTEIFFEGGSGKFDLIIGADGVGSVVRKNMVEQIDCIQAESTQGKGFIYSFCMDNYEELKDLDPNKVYFASILGNACVYSMLKTSGNRRGCCFMDYSGDIRNEADTIKLLNDASKLFLKAMTPQNLRDFVNFKKKKASRVCKVN